MEGWHCQWEVDRDRIDYSVDFHNQSLKEYLPQSNGKLADFLPEFYHVHGDSDYVIDVDLTRCFTRELGKKGFRYVYRELDGVNHSKVFQGDPINMVVNDDVFQMDPCDAQQDPSPWRNGQGNARDDQKGRRHHVKFPGHPPH